MRSSQAPILHTQLVDDWMFINTFHKACFIDDVQVTRGLTFSPNGVHSESEYSGELKSNLISGGFAVKKSLFSEKLESTDVV